MKNTIFNSILLSMVMIVGATTYAFAQNAPGSLAENPSRTVSETQNPIVQAPTELTDNPCPEPKRALSSTPDDMAKIQEDITRFTLCVQRAQLLERLNELAESNIGTIDTALNLTVSAPPSDTDGNATPGIMPSVPMPQLPESVSRLLEDDDDAANMSGAIGSGEQSMAEPAKQAYQWRVRDIQGTGGSVSARLVNNDGMMFKVKQGDKLPEDGGTVQSLSNTMVIIARDGDTEILKWVE